MYGVVFLAIFMLAAALAFVIGITYSLEVVARRYKILFFLKYLVPLAILWSALSETSQLFFVIIPVVVSLILCVKWDMDRFNGY